MISLDVIKSRNAIDNLAECEKKMRHMYECIEEVTINLSRMDNNPQLSDELTRQAEELAERMRSIRCLRQCLEKVLYSYVVCEERNATYVEEVSLVEDNFSGEFEEAIIPEWIFQVLG